MNNFDVPRGIMRNVTDTGIESTEYTLWTSVADEEPQSTTSASMRTPLSTNSISKIRTPPALPC